MQVLTYGVEFATDKLQETMTHKFFEFLETWLLIYVDNMLVHTLTRRAHLEALRTLFERCKRINIHTRKEKCSFLQQSIKTMGFVVEHNVIKPDPVKIDMLKQKRERPHQYRHCSLFWVLFSFIETCNHTWHMFLILFTLLLLGITTFNGPTN